ncbi:MAG TPA: alpha/beta hydrolase [Galbitalea sp.]|jgi:pimeloyl-ACP methyl ester carboxylesterase|nr:alpha/beta hydrolase [Galbitalea sp.]
MTSSAETLMLDRGEGHIAYDIRGTGPLVICAPGMGDIRQTWRYLVPATVSAGYRVITFDLRGHGESDTTFTAFDDDATASDIIALTQSYGPAVIVGNSMGAAAGVIAASAHPELITGLVLVGPFVREPKVNPIMKTVLTIATAQPWAAPVWKAYRPSLYAGLKPADQQEFANAANAAMRRRGYQAAFSKTTRSSHVPAEAALPGVKAPALVVMGELDPDFPKSALEAQWISEQLDAEVLMVPDAGHYPQSQRPDVVNPAVISFLDGLPLDRTHA